MSRKILLNALAAVGLMLASIAGHAAPTVIDPTTGLSGDFIFGGTLGTVQTDPADGWSITVGSDSVIDVSVDDCCISGDEFALLLDGGLIPWTSSNPGGPGLFFGHAIGVFLSAGTHIFDFMLTASCCSSGLGSYSFSAVRPPTSSVPEPSALALLGLGLLGAASMRRRLAKK